MNEIQEKEFRILMEIEKVLLKHNLRYFAIGGTCLGAIRHGGFIPWDDDIDIAMPRKDYEVFRTEYYKELPEKYKKLDCDNSVGNVFLFTKIFDSTTTYVEYYAKNNFDRYTGVFVDVMPVDGLPDGEKAMRAVEKRIETLSHWNCLNRPWIHENHTLIEKMKAFLKKSLQRIVPFNYFSSRILSKMSLFDYETSKYIFFTWRYKSPRNRRIYQKRYFEEVIEVPFEYGTICVPKMYDDYLKQDFGDYMKLPPVSEQKSVHSVYICDMNRPCSYYVTCGKEGIQIK